MNWKLIVLFALLLSGCGVVYDKATPVTEVVTAATTVVTVNVTNESQAAAPSSSTTAPFFLIHEGNLTIYFIDAFSALVAFPNKDTMLVDAGGVSTAETTLKKVRDAGYGNVNYTVLTNDRDYRIGGAGLLIDRLRISKGYYSGVGDDGNEEYRLLKPKLQNFTRVALDSQVSFGSVEVRFLVPYDDGTGFRLESEQNSFFVKVIYGQFTMLFGSDCVGECEDRIMLDSNVEADVVAMPLQGQCEKYETSTFFLKQADAQLYVGNNICTTILYKMDVLGKTSFDQKEKYLVVTTDGSKLSWYEVKK